MNTKLFNAVISNNVNALEDIIESNPDLNLNMRKGDGSLWYYAVNHRSRQCFDYLIKLNRFPNNLSFDNSGLSIAINYYLNNPNEENEYYMNKLFEKTIIVTSYDFSDKIIENKVIFKKLLNKITRTVSFICNLFSKFRKNSEYYYIFYDWIQENRESFTDDDYEQIIGAMIYYACKNNLVSVLDYCKSEGHNINLYRDINYKLTINIAIHEFTKNYHRYS